MDLKMGTAFNGLENVQCRREVGGGGFYKENTKIQVP